jgi:hypothetical protein
MGKKHIPCASPDPANRPASIEPDELLGEARGPSSHARARMMRNVFGEPTNLGYCFGYTWKEVPAVKRWTRILVGLGIALSLQTAAHARADRIYTTINVGDPYRGTLTFQSAPDLTLIPNTSVYTLRDDTDYSLYRFDGWYYLVDDGYWYRARSWRGPFTYVRMGTVPRDVVTVPMRYRRNWSTTTSTDYPEGSRVTRRYTVRDSRFVRPGQRYRGASLMFRTQPRMAMVPGTRVFYVRGDTDRDLYRYGSNWYYVENGVWYVADSWRGPFFTMRWRDVPVTVRRVPANYRRNWTYAGANDYEENNDTDNGADTRAVVRIGSRGDFEIDTVPSMSIIPGTSVYFSRDEADYDLYRYGSSWYLADNGDWYRADSWRGPFLRIRTSSVPRPVFTIPSGYRKTWAPVND